MAPAFAQFEQKYKKKITIININVDNADLAKDFAKYKKTEYIPETVTLRAGKIVEQKTGALTLAELEKMVAKASR